MSDKQKKAIDDIMDLFDLGGSEKEEQSSDYSNTAESDSGSKPSFDEMITDIGDSISDVGSSTPVLTVTESKDPVNEKTPEPAVKEQKVEVKTIVPKESVKENIKDDISISDDDEGVNINVDDIFGDSGSTKKESEDESSNVEIVVSEGEADAEGQDESSDAEEADAKPTPEKTVEQSKTEDSTEGSTPFDLPKENASKEKPVENKPSVTVIEKVKNNVRLVNGQVSWLVKPPSDKYASFYEEKAETLEYIISGGHIPFENYKYELRDARVDLDVQTHDTEEIYNRMKLVQLHKERLNEISLHVNEQYYAWDRFIDLMRGQLARIDQEKNAERRNGVVFQHMRDMEFYYVELKFLHNQIGLVMKNLDSAWETLNRKVTIALSNLNQKEPERYGNPQRGIVNNYQPKTTQSSSQPEPKSTPSSDIDLLGNFDGIEGPSVEVPKQQKGSREVDW